MPCRYARPVFTDEPRSLRHPDVLARRHEMLRTAPQVQELRDWAGSLQRRRGAVVPFVDPAEAGTDARVLMLMEAPGPMTNRDNRRPGSGFISVDNDDGTAANAWRTRDAAGLDEHLVLVWNIVPWYLGPAKVKPSASDRREGAAELVDLMRLLPRLEVVLLSGRHAQRGWNEHVRPKDPPVAVLETWHPSPQTLWNPERRAHLERTMRDAVRMVAA